ncbi:MAG: sodium:solute symporter family transporter [Planctomycetota bacterium]|jgi:Na+/pantothenate symporter
MNPTVLSVVWIYFSVSLYIGFWVARKEKNKADDFFLAGQKFPRYAAAMSMTGSNVDTEHFIGMFGTAYAFGSAPVTFEWSNFETNWNKKKVLFDKSRNGRLFRFVELSEFEGQIFASAAGIDFTTK